MTVIAYLITTAGECLSVSLVISRLFNVFGGPGKWKTLVKSNSATVVLSYDVRPIETCSNYTEKIHF